MYVSPARGLPTSLGEVPDKADGPTPGPAEESIAGLAKRVSAYLARVVGALADFEDQLLLEDGFFAREEHFEAQINSLRREFDQNRRAQARYPRPAAAATPQSPATPVMTFFHIGRCSARTPFSAIRVTVLTSVDRVRLGVSADPLCAPRCGRSADRAARREPRPRCSRP